MIKVGNLCKIYRTYEKEEGLTGSLKALFKRKYRDVEALKGVSFGYNHPLLARNILPLDLFPQVIRISSKLFHLNIFFISL